MIYDHFLCIKKEQLSLYCDSAVKRVPSVAAVEQHMNSPICQWQQTIKAVI